MKPADWSRLAVINLTEPDTPSSLRLGPLIGGYQHLIKAEKCFHPTLVNKHKSRNIYIQIKMRQLVDLRCLPGQKVFLLQTL